MKFLFLTLVACFVFNFSNAQKLMTPELLWSLGRVHPIGITKDGNSLIYSVTRANVEKNNFSSTHYKIALDGGKPLKIEKFKELVRNKNISISGNELFAKEVKVEKVLGEDYYPYLTESTAHIYTDLDYRHWDTWNTGKFSHVFYKPAGTKEAIDIMKNEPYYCPQQPFGGEEDYIWNNDGSAILYVSKKKTGAAYATSTNSDIYRYDLMTKKTINLTENNKGYDQSPQFSPQGTLAWLRMDVDGYESDKNDIIIRIDGKDVNLTQEWDGTVFSFLWNKKGAEIYFTAPINGTIQLFKIGVTSKKRTVQQITKGQFDVTSMIALQGDKMFVTRTDMNHATEIFAFDLKHNTWQQITRVNNKVYDSIKLSSVKRHYSTTVDGKKLLSWIIYPPNFDATKKYPTLLYCQGGPQSPLSQFYSFRWNFQAMAAQGYIVVAPNRRGMPGFGVEWNEAVSEDWGGKAIQDYLTAIDDFSKNPFVDTARLGAIGASFGGYSVFYLAGHHEKRFKTFIAHDGVFDLRSMYGTTEELFFVNHDMGGAYWEKENAAAQKTYKDYNPINFVANWDTPIMIIQGGKDYRVPIEQGLEAFQAARLQGIKSKLLYFPNENHWVLHPQNGLVWQHEFFKWLEETL